MKLLAIDLFCGLGGWTDGLLAEGYDVIGYDVEAHEYDGERYPAQLVLQDVRTLHGSQFKDAALIVASPPCQAFSFMAMPFSRGKARAAAIRADETGAEFASLTELFRTCFRIQREACEAAGRHIPLIVENVRGAQPWVGRAKWNFGSYYLWGDVPALIMPRTLSAVKAPGMNWSDRNNPLRHASFTQNGGRAEAVKGGGGSWCNGAYDPLHGRNTSSKSKARKAASARIAKIPFALSSWIARVYRPLPHAENGRTKEEAAPRERDGL
jgi:hypothetical protein